MITLLKLGGSLVTNKKKRRSFRRDLVHRLSHEIRSALDKDSNIQLIIGHGSGSFGHFEASAYGTAQGVRAYEEWLGFTRVAHAAATLNHKIAEALIAASVPVFRSAPSAIASSDNKTIKEFYTKNIQIALKHGLVPLVYGDVMLDASLGGTIASTETVFDYLALHLPVSRIFLLGEVDGVLDNEQSLIPVITPETVSEIEQALGKSRGVDVTGGMDTKVRGMINLVAQRPEMQIWICNGLVEGLIHDALVGKSIRGTLIQA